MEPALYSPPSQVTRKLSCKKITVELPKKHNKGGQSSNRFARLREEKRAAYVSKIAEMAKTNFINSENKATVKGIIMAGSADFKTVVAESPKFDPIL